MTAPAFHHWLLQEKFNRSIRVIADVLQGASVLSVCGGSGMDAEFLAHAGAANVVVADISERAAVRTAERARRHAVARIPVVADAERLPFADRSFDLVYVHAPGHHLQEPGRGLREMMRVSRVAISITQPAAAAATALAAKVGLAENVEEAGNRVMRLRLDEACSLLSSGGFSVVAAERYAMYYRHRPGLPARLFSTEAVASSRPGVVSSSQFLVPGQSHRQQAHDSGDEVSGSDTSSALVAELRPRAHRYSTAGNGCRRLARGARPSCRCRHRSSELSGAPHLRRVSRNPLAHREAWARKRPPVLALCGSREAPFRQGSL